MTTAATLPLDVLSERLRRLTAQDGSGVLVSATVSVPDLDTTALFARATGDRFLWERPAEGFSLLGIGAAARIAVRGPERFPQALARWRELSEQAVVDSTAPAPFTAPLCVGGFAFDADNGQDASWESFPDGLLVVPRIVFARKGDSCWATVNCLLTRESNPEELAACASGELSRLLGAGRSPEAEAAGAGDLTFGDEPGPDHWREAVNGVAREIASGGIEKVVLARRVKALLQRPIEAAHVLRRLKDGYPQCTTFAFAQGDGCFLGATPERLVRREGRAVWTDALAGSAARGQTEAEDRRLGDTLLSDAKERREHAMVVEATRNALAPLCDRLSVPQTPGLLRMSNVQHLHTPIEGALRSDATVLELAARLHPTPAAGGLPQPAALSLIRRYEPFGRGWYAGPIGWMDGSGDGEFAVAIRSALLRGREALLYAGCGIVAGSDPDKEYAESRLKLRPMLWALNGGTE